MTIPRELAFDVAEYRQRVEHVRVRMVTRGLDALVLFGPHSITYLSGMASESMFGIQALVVPLDRDPVLVLLMLEAGRAANSVWLDEVETYPVAGAREHGPPPRPWDAPGQPDLVAAVVAVLRRMGLERGRLGVEQPEGWLEVKTHAGLLAALPDARVVDPFGVVETVRRTKSPAELAYIRRAAAFSEAGAAAGLAAVHAGARDHEIGAAICAAMYAAGSELVCWGPVVAAGYRAAAPHGTWNGRRMLAGETVFLELTGQAGRYIAPLMRTAVLGKPTGQMTRIAAAVEGALASILATARPGVAAADVAAVARQVLDPVLTDAYFHGNFGYPVGIGYPVAWNETLGFRLNEENREPLEAGMVFHLPISVRKYGEFGVCLSQTILITPEGAEPITTSPATLTVIDA